MFAAGILVPVTKLAVAAAMTVVSVAFGTESAAVNPNNCVFSMCASGKRNEERGRRRRKGEGRVKGIRWTTSDAIVTHNAWTEVVQLRAHDLVDTFIEM